MHSQIQIGRARLHPCVVGLWIVQVLLAVTFVGGGLWKLAMPIPELAASPWPQPSAAAP